MSAQQQFSLLLSLLGDDQICNKETDWVQEQQQKNIICLYVKEIKKSSPEVKLYVAMGYLVFDSKVLWRNKLWHFAFDIFSNQSLVIDP